MNESEGRKISRQNSWRDHGACKVYSDPPVKEGTLESVGSISAEGDLNFCVRGIPPRKPERRGERTYTLVTVRLMYKGKQHGTVQLST